MNSYASALSILQNTPKTIKELISQLPDSLLSGGDNNSWDTKIVLGHLIHGENTDWVPRINIILSDDANKSFEPFVRIPKLNDKTTVQALLKEFIELREKNLGFIKSLPIKENLNKTGIHPSLGKVTLSELISTWAMHDLNHLIQITRSIANHFKEEVGPWKQYLTNIYH